MTDAAQPPNLRPVLAKVIQELGWDAGSCLLEQLGLVGVAKARLLCRAVRDVMDQRVCTLRFHLRGAQGQGRQPSWAKWPCSSDITVLVEEGDQPDLELSQRLLQIFSAEPREARQRITRVKIAAAFPISGFALFTLPFWLPALQELDLAHVRVTGDAPTEELLYNGLASLPSLKHLVTYSYRSLERVSQLAATLRVLKVRPGWFAAGGGLTAAAVAGISHLTRLQKLSLGDSRCSPDLTLQLLNSLPPALEVLKLGGVGVEVQDDHVGLRLRLEGGWAMEGSVWSAEEDELSLGNLALVLHQVLIPCRKVGTQLPLLEVGPVEVGGSQLLAGEALQQLQAGLRRCGSVTLEALCVAADTAPEVALQPVGLLGAPKELQMTIARHQRSYDLCLRTRRDTTRLASREPTQPPPASTAAAQRTGAPPLKPGEEILAAALERLAAVAAGAAGQPTGDAAGRLLMLRGPAIRFLVEAPEALTAWVQQLAARTDAALSAQDGLGGGSSVVRLQALPAAGSLLLECGAGQAVRQAVATEAASMAAGAGMVGMLQVSPVERGKPAEGQVDRSEAVPVGYALVEVLELVLAELWWAAVAESGHGTATSTELGCWAVSQQLRVRDLVQELPAEVDLDLQAGCSPPASVTAVWPGRANYSTAAAA